ncbi:hypothetical protein O1611_g4125 [Lasiodiplodia mahajangana]|uniref:Uncharacterized protein n=1 Tax=Lasiodiplodia mahajangana TaxID=1108764 RepID=A0ACC2JQI2_9PEZI|nr:hypothetical protein O1611_g4125 [Lasiodiplodia mahajangana]
MDIPLPTATTFSSSSTPVSTTDTNTRTITTSNGLLANSPSDLSHSSGPSHTSTRNTSPDPTSSIALSCHSSPLVDLSVATTSIKYTPRTLFDCHTSMDKNAFQSVNERRNKLTNERPSGNLSQHAQQQQQQQQPQNSRSGIQGQPNHYRSLVSSNWRAHGAEDAALSQPQTTYTQFEASTNNHHAQLSSLRTTPFPNPRLDQHRHLQPATGVAAYPNLGPISDADLDGSFAYCYDRGNGQYTRLVPADMLPPLQNIPAVQQGCAGMVVIPQPRGLPPNGYSSNTEAVALRGPPVTPTLPADTIQSRIDNIVAATPPTPSHLPGHPGGGSGTAGSGPLGQRRPKIFCDKWVHEGVCAFTQQGCKYKHEMPSDKFTQHQLGLFHGYPQWWKKHQADLARQREAPPSEVPKNSGQGNDSRLNDDRYLNRANNPTIENGGPRDGGLNADTGGQLAWRHSGEYGGESRALGPPPHIGRTAASRGMVGGMRNSMVTSSPSSNLSPCPVSYGSRSPFGPIAPPTRNKSSTTIPNENVHGSPVVQPTVESHATPQGNPRSSLPETRTTISPVLPTSNPYASLDALDKSGDQNTNEKVAYGEALYSGGARLS